MAASAENGGPRPRSPTQHDASQAHTDARPQSLARSQMRVVDIASYPADPPAFGPSCAYAQTSQAKNWRFSRASLAEIRQQSNSAARRRLQTIWNEEQQQGESSASASASEIPFLSVEDEMALIGFYLVKVGQIVRAFRLPELVEATATTYVKRFYLRNTCMDFHPKNVVITCIFLASKTENYPLKLSTFARKLAEKSKDPAAGEEENRRTVLELEFLVSQSLGFEYGVVGAHRALFGLVLDLQTLPAQVSDGATTAAAGGGITREQAHDVAAKAHTLLTTSRLTDAEIVYTPSQIALACIWGSQGESWDGKELVRRWLGSKEQLASNLAVEGKVERVRTRAAEVERLRRARIANARRTRGKAGVKAVEDQLAAETPVAREEAEFDDELLRTQPLGLSKPDLETLLDEIEALIRARETGGYTGAGKSNPADLERVKDIDKRQKLCMNPEKVPGSRLFLKRQAEELEAAQRKRLRDISDDEDEDDAIAAVAKPEQDPAPPKGTKRPLIVDSDDEEEAKVPISKDFSIKPDPTV
ncbi:cyclin-like protein [Testicularia cyperi]|uniref:Cyclin-like protein n=1 Tax=Testicularia cyperi TaxID=1882483 RepID=A0A317XUX6_9BASI|nr:cyclin-like protein [Testicularia cyperi]